MRRGLTSRPSYVFRPGFESSKVLTQCNPHTVQDALLACRSMRNGANQLLAELARSREARQPANAQSGAAVHRQQQAQQAEHGRHLTARLGRHRRHQVPSACSLITCGRFALVHAPTYVPLSGESDPLSHLCACIAVAKWCLVHSCKAKAVIIPASMLRQGGHCPLCVRMC